MLVSEQLNQKVILIGKLLSINFIDFSALVACGEHHLNVMIVFS